ncbi:MAG: lipopolysaccharide heptosyltransferase family protein [Cyanobacteria bacterium MAG APA_bin_95]|nr:lipopolysaccharide heptosyltransferase family protein [Cyanobacteria bacterium MAG APA_bin_95]
MMQVLTLLPGGEEDQLQALPALATLGEQRSARLQVVCPARAASIWTLLPAVERCIPFAFGQRWSLADWTNLLGNVREPDFQVSLNLSTDWSVDLLLSLSHIPMRVASGGVSATERVKQPTGWRGQALAAWLQPLGVHFDANAYRLPLPRRALAEARAALPQGNGPALLLGPDTVPGWSPEDWQELVEAVNRADPSVRLLWLAREGEEPAGVHRCPAATVMAEAATVASVDVVFTAEPRLAQLAVLTGTALVAAGMADPRRLPQRDAVKPLPPLSRLRPKDVLQVLVA